MRATPLVLLAATATLAACGGNQASDPSLVPRTVGPGPAFRPSLSPAVARAAAIAGMRCSTREPARFGAHVELFAAGRVVVVPAGIGLAPPRRQDGAYVRDARCAYPLVTREPTGVIEIARADRRTLGDLFAVWGRPLSRSRLAGFRGPVRVHVDGRAWRGHPGAVPLSRHAQVVVQVGPHVVPHARYRFPPGL